MSLSIFSLLGAYINIRLSTRVTFKLYLFSLSICELFIALLEVVYANKF